MFWLHLNFSGTDVLFQSGILLRTRLEEHVSAAEVQVQPKLGDSKTLKTSSRLLNSTAAISIVTQMELIVGCRDKAELREVNKFLRRFVITAIDEAIANKSLELLHLYYLSHNLLIADSLIAATALILDVPFVSKNQRDYRFIGDLNLTPYP